MRIAVQQCHGVKVAGCLEHADKLLLVFTVHLGHQCDELILLGELDIRVRIYQDGSHTENLHLFGKIFLGNIEIVLGTSEGQH